MNRSAFRKAAVGLGNPGFQYQWTRHNLGYLAVDHYLENYGRSRKSHTLKHATASQTGPFLLAKPTTFMNRSGIAVAEIAIDFGIDLKSILVIYDDYALGFGTLRLRTQGGAGGHNGMKSIIDLFGTDEFPRLRLGIADAMRREDISDYVLEPFSKDQERMLPDFLDRAAAAIDCFFQNDIETAMNRFNG